MAFRTERDSMGEVQVPATALWGASTQRALANFNISGRPVRSELIRAYGLIKASAARSNAGLRLLDAQLAEAIARAADEVARGSHADQFPVDLLQTGSGTSTNMNVNEVIANLANQSLGEPLGTRQPVHPNDHVNLGQSSNDTFPSALHIAVAVALSTELEPALTHLAHSLKEKSDAWMPIVKLGRTHLMDATPIRLGQVFSGYAHQGYQSLTRAARATACCMPLALGGTAVGTGINTHPEFASLCCDAIGTATGLPFRETDDHFSAQSSQDIAVEVSGLLKAIAVFLSKVANDIRWLAAGPRGGLGELILPALQPGSSIMPGKVNPVVCEAVIQACARVVANDTAVTQAAFGGVGSLFELNVGMPLIAEHLLDSVLCLARSAVSLNNHVIADLQVDEARCRELLERSLMMVTRLVPEIGYDRAAEVAKTALGSGASIRHVVLAENLIPAERLDQLLDPAAMT